MTRGGAVTLEEAPGREERVRLFVALELPERVRDALTTWRGRALRGAAGLRLLSDDHLHVTLCFLGWQPVPEVEHVARACERVSGTRRPELSLGEPMWLPPRRPRVVTVRLEDVGGRLTELQSELSRVLQAGGWYEPEARAYLPHVTVARAGRGTRVPTGPLLSPPPLSFTGDLVTLFRSHLSPRGARYEALASVSLG